MKKLLYFLVICTWLHMRSLHCGQVTSVTSRTAPTALRGVLPKLPGAPRKLSTSPVLPTTTIKTPVKSPSPVSQPPQSSNVPVSTPSSKQYGSQQQNVPGSSFFEQFKDTKKESTKSRLGLGATAGIAGLIGYSLYNQEQEEAANKWDAQQWVDALRNDKDVNITPLLKNKEMILSIISSPAHMAVLLENSDGNSAIGEAPIDLFFQEALKKNDVNIIEAWTDTIATLQYTVMNSWVALIRVKRCLALFAPEQQLSAHSHLLDKITANAVTYITPENLKDLKEGTYSYLQALCKADDSSAAIVTEKFIALATGKGTTLWHTLTDWWGTQHEEKNMSHLTQLLNQALASPKAAKQITDHPELLSTLLKSPPYGPVILQALADSTKQPNDKFSEAIYQYVINAPLQKQPMHNQVVLFSLMSAFMNTEIESYITKYLQSPDANPLLLLDVWKRNKAYTVNIDMMTQQYHDDARKALLQAVYYHTHPEQLDPAHYASLSPTTKHLINHFDIARPYVESYLANPEQYRLFDRYVREADALEQEGYVTFVHGQQLSFYEPEIWTTKLWELKNNDTADQFVFAHIKPVPQGTLSSLEQTATRIQLIRGGEHYGSSGDLLYMNRYFFGNSALSTSSTARYVRENRNIVGTTDTKKFMKQAFEVNGYGHIYDQYKGQLDALQEESEKLSSTGNLLLVAVPKAQVDSSVFTLAVEKGKGRFKKIGSLWDYLPWRGNVLSNIEAPETTPFKQSLDTIQFALPMTADAKGGLNPHSGIKIVPINGVEEKKWQAFKQKEEKLWQQIKQTIEKEKR